MSYFIEFFQIDREGNRHMVHQQLQNARSVAEAKSLAASMIKYTTFSGIVADFSIIRDQRGTSLGEVKADARGPKGQKRPEFQT